MKFWGILSVRTDERNYAPLKHYFIGYSCDTATIYKATETDAEELRLCTALLKANTWV